MISASDIKGKIRDIPDFPQKGVMFKDITPILKDPKIFHGTIELLAQELKKYSPDFIVAIESRGFMFGTAVADKLNVGFIPVRKKGKLPYKTEQVAYELEYGQAIIEIHQDALSKGDRVAIIDDLLATGGTALATAQLVEKLGAKVAKVAFVVELLFFEGRKKLSDYDIFSIVQY